MGFLLALFVLIFYLAILALAIFLNYYIAKQFYSVANMKGHYEKKYLWIPFFLGIVGYLLVIALPDISKNHKVFCTKCGHEIAPNTSFCPHCGNQL